MATNSSTQILHTADTHVGYRQYHQPEREEDYLNAFAQVIDAALEEDVDAVVHAGDLFDSSRPSTDRIYDVLRELQRLVEADIPFLSVVGNHDGRRDRQWLDIFEDIGYAKRLGSEGTSVGAVELYGLDHVDRSHRDELDYEYEPPSDGTELSALVAHGLFTPFPNGNWDSKDVVQNASVEFDMILAGDDHTPQSATLDTDAETQITYPGSTERTAADQREPRGYHLVTIDPDGGLDTDEGENGDEDEETSEYAIDTTDTERVSTERRLLDTRGFVYVDVALEPDEGSERVLEQIRDNIDSVEDTVLVVTITGDGEHVPPGPIEEFGLERGALVVRVNDRRTLEDDVIEYSEVSFADPEAAIEERKQELELSKAGSDLEEIVRSDAVASTNIASNAEDRVKEWVAERGLEEFEREAVSAEDGSETEREGGGGGDTSGSRSEENTVDDETDPLDDEVVERVEAEASTIESTPNSKSEVSQGDDGENGEIEATSNKKTPTGPAEKGIESDATGENENQHEAVEESDVPEDETDEDETDEESPTADQDAETETSQSTLF